MTDPRLHLNRTLGSAGLATLDNPGGVCQQLGYLVEDHEHFRQLITKCVPAERRNMYEALKPHLRFTPHALDVYLALSGDLAERKQLPVVGEDGKLKPFNPPEIRTQEDAAAQEAVNASLAKVVLTLTCRKCTKEESFAGQTRRGAVYLARTAGWTYNELKQDCREVCPDCL